MLTILHADMDAFYAAVEQRDYPELRGKPVIVSGLSPRSVVTTASYEARAFGVHSAMPAMQARKLCPQGIFVRPRLPHYVAIAKQLRALFAEITPQVEPLSLDEAFLDISGSLKLFGAAEDIGRRLKKRVAMETQLTISVGIAPTKLVAKIASAYGKPDGLLVIEPQQVQAFLNPLDVGQIWGVGATMRASLHALGIRTIGQLAAHDPGLLEHHLGHFGRDLWEMAHGHDARRVDADRHRKSYGEECTFDTDLRDGDRLRGTIAEQAEALAARLRQDGCVARTVTLKMKLAKRTAPGKYPIRTRRLTLERPTADGRAIRDSALQLWESNHDGLEVRLIGVAVDDLRRANTGQLSMFDTRDEGDALNRALDAINTRFGRIVIKRGATFAKDRR